MSGLILPKHRKLFLRIDKHFILMLEAAMIKRKILKTKRLIIRPYNINDYNTWFDAYVNRLPKRNKYDRDPMNPKQCSKAEFRKMLQRHERISKKDKCYIYGVFEKKIGTLLGVVDIFIIVRDHYQMGNLGYQIHNRYWGKGYGKEAANAALKIGFRDLKLNRLEAAISIDNSRSIALAKALDMRREGIKRRYIYEDNKWIDQITFVANPEDMGMKASKPYKP